MLGHVWLSLYAQLPMTIVSALDLWWWAFGFLFSGGPKWGINIESTNQKAPQHLVAQKVNLGFYPKRIYIKIPTFKSMHTLTWSSPLTMAIKYKDLFILDHNIKVGFQPL